jgi:hypothetical protein
VRGVEKVDKEEIQNKIRLAKELVGGTPADPLTQIAFREVFRMLLQESSSIAGEETKPRTKRGALPTQISEFLVGKNITTHIDRVVAILYYSYRKSNEPATIAELEEAYSNARVKQPRNFSDLLATCIRKGYVVEARDKKDGKKAWQITLTGEKFVEEEMWLT